jgi:hypothetical protein
MSRYSDRACPEYQTAFQYRFSMRVKREGPAAIAVAQQSISIWRDMRLRALNGACPSLLDYRATLDPNRFLMTRHRKKLDKALRLGMTTETLERGGLFDALKHHQASRAFRKASKKRRVKRAQKCRFPF